jgi:hypothetical protein
MLQTCSFVVRIQCKANCMTKCLKLGKSLHVFARIMILYTLKDTKKKHHVKCIHLAVHGFIPVSTVVIYVTTGKWILQYFLFLCSFLHKYCEIICWIENGLFHLLLLIFWIRSQMVHKRDSTPYKSKWRRKYIRYSWNKHKKIKK